MVKRDQVGAIGVDPAFLGVTTKDMSALEDFFSAALRFMHQAGSVLRNEKEANIQKKLRAIYCSGYPYILLNVHLISSSFLSAPCFIMFRSDGEVSKRK